MSHSSTRRRNHKDPKYKGNMDDETSSRNETVVQEPRAYFMPRRSFVKLLLASGALATFFRFYTNWNRDISGNAADTYAICSPLGRKIYTVDSQNSNVQCILVHDEYIVDAADLDVLRDRWSNAGYKEIRSRISSWDKVNVKMIPESSIIVPGMTDAHGHTLEYGASRLLPLEGCRDATEVVRKVRHYIESRPKSSTSQLIEGWGWDHTAWPLEKLPNYEYLERDPVVRDYMVVLQSKDGHAQWVSKAMLEKMLPLPEEVDGGIIVRDESGNPTGVFVDRAQELIKRSPLTDEDRLERFHIAVSEALSKGLTSLHDAGFDPASLAFFKKRSELGKLPIRIYGMTHFNESAEYWGDKRDKVIDHNRLTARSVKIFADGALRSGGAALYEPYSDNPETRGLMRIEPEVLNDFVPKFVRDGWQVNIHAIGDRANAIVIDSLELAMSREGKTGQETRARIEHAQIILPEDAKRLARLGAIASVQPTHVVSDMWYAQERLGPERIKHLYPYRTIIDAGARIALGSDFPVEDMNPLAGIQAAVTRLTSDGRSPHGPNGWFPNQRLTRLEALRGFTIDPAYASFSEDRLGSLERGKRADFVVLSQDIMSIPAIEIVDAKVIATVLDGQVVYGEI